MYKDFDPIAQLKFGTEMESLSGHSKQSISEVEVVRRWEPSHSRSQYLSSIKESAINLIDS